MAGEVLALANNDTDIPQNIGNEDILVQCGPLGEPIFASIQTLYHDDSLMANYKQLMVELKIPSVLLLKITL